MPAKKSRDREKIWGATGVVFNIFVTAPFTVSLNISASSGGRRMKLSPFDAAQRGDSNKLCYILLRPLDAEIFNETVNGAVTKMLNADLLMLH